jgi:hypothetical protein
MMLLLLLLLMMMMMMMKKKKKKKKKKRKRTCYIQCGRHVFFILFSFMHSPKLSSRNINQLLSESDKKCVSDIQMNRHRMKYCIFYVYKLSKNGSSFYTKEYTFNYIVFTKTRDKE